MLVLNNSLEALSQEEHGRLLEDYCREISILVQNQAQVIKEENFSKLEKYIEEFQQLMKNIDTIRVYLQKFDSRDDFLGESTKKLMKQVVEENTKNIRMLKGYRDQVKREMLMVNQIGNYINMNIVSKARIIDKNI